MSILWHGPIFDTKRRIFDSIYLYSKDAPEYPTFRQEMLQLNYTFASAFNDFTNGTPLFSTSNALKVK